MGCGPIEREAGREGERTIANLRCLVWSIAAARRVPQLGMRMRRGRGRQQQAGKAGTEEGRARGEALYSRKFERDRKERRRGRLAV